MRSRRVYATTGARIYLDFKAGEHGMGEVIKSHEAPTFSIAVAAPRAIDRVEVVKHAPGIGRPFPVVFTARPDGWSYEGTFTDTEFDANSLYYLRVVQSDLEMAWSSPIWVDRAEY